MRKVRAWLGIGFAQGNHEEVFEYEDDTTDAEIDEEIKDWMNNYLDWGWCEVEEEDD